jgi:type VI secretion system secreted protein VgrG
LGEFVANFINAIDYVLQNEGGFVDDPSDSGGATNFGITEETLSRKRGSHATREDIKSLTRDEAKQVYYAFWWTPLQLSSVQNEAIATAILDMSVNMGLSVVVRFAQISCCVCGKPVTVDNKMGEATVKALNEVVTKDWFEAFEDQVSSHYENIAKKNPKDQKFLKGWLARAQRLYDLIETA